MTVYTLEGFPSNGLYEKLNYFYVYTPIFTNQKFAFINFSEF